MRTLIQLKADAVDAGIMAKTHKEVWLEYEELTEDVKAEVERREDKKGIRGLARNMLVCMMLLVFAGGCNMVNGAFKDGAWLLDQAVENTEVQDK